MANHEEKDMNVELKPCPFCGDRMENDGFTIRHVEQGRCIIGQMGWYADYADRWNERVAVNAVEGPTDAED